MSAPGSGGLLQGVLRSAGAFRAAWRRRAQLNPARVPRGMEEYISDRQSEQAMPLPWPARAILPATIVLLSVIAIWMYITYFDIIVSARGTIQPDGRTQVVQAVIGGKVDVFHVEDGDRVEAGQELMELDAAQMRSELADANAGWDAARLDAAMGRMLAEADQTQDTAPILADDPQLAEIAPDHIAQQQILSDALHARRLAEDRRLSAQIRELEQSVAVHAEQGEAVLQLQEKDEAVLAEQLSGNEAERLKLARKVSLAVVRLDSTRRLHERGVVSRGAVHSDEDQLLTRQNDHDRLETASQTQHAEGERLAVERSKEHARHSGAAAGAQAKIDVLRREAAAAEASFRGDMLRMATTKSREAQALRERVVRLEQQLAEHTIRAPVEGVVEQLAVHTVGAAVRSGQLLLSVVPSDATLVVVAEVVNKDVGFVRVGQTVQIKLDAFPYTRHGKLEGRVQSISEDAILREGAEPVYQLRIELLDDAVVVDGKRKRVRPGMTLVAEMRTGERRAYEYFLDPFLRSKDEGLRER